MSQTLNYDAVFEVFSDPVIIRQFSLKQWENLIRILRGNDLLGSFYYLLARSKLINDVPEFVFKHISSAKIYADRQSHQIKHEAKELASFLARDGISPIFLKGAAYVLNNDTNHYGRIMSDIDILVKKSQLEQVESVLKKNDWVVKPLDEYDEQYYRKWAHEIPPYTHFYRGTTLDVHHTLIPPVSGIFIAESLLFDELHNTSSSLLILADETKVLHCVIHLFFNEDFSKSFRDLLDIHLLLLDIETNKKSLKDFFLLAHKCGFKREIYYVIRLRELIFKRKLSDDECEFVDKFSFAHSADIFIKLILYRAFMPSHDLISSKSIHVAKFIMYFRGHFLKMPLHVLIPHFFIKTKRAIVMSVYGAHHYEK
ncbi:nucleotidyltransferase family protein [Flavobacterium sp. W21_SRS_FM6]|uniref:nucleotidyltransferase family protein n=1 Tax=Flavobacterium sp. W21_SRS_FM6 TaxID=3240268 RepID=UPI003F927C9A